MFAKNIKVKLRLLFVSLLFCALAFSQDGKKSEVIKTIDGKKYYIHTVEKNQSLYAIAKIYSIDLNSLLADNPDAIDGLKTGDELKIPTKTEALPTVTSPSDLDKYVFHKVEKKETVYGICKKYKITEEQLKAMNPEIINGLKQNQLLKVGLKTSPAVITTPLAETTDSNYTWHLVKDGETLYGISKLYSVTVEEIQKLNGGLSSGIKSGQKLKVKIKAGNQQQVNAAQNTVNPANGETQVGNAVYIRDTTRMGMRPRKESYTVGLFLPIQTTEVDMAGLDWIRENRKNFPSVSTLANDFYEGYTRAVDSLKKTGLNIKTVIFDLNENDSARLATVTGKQEFKSLDFIIGPWYSGSFRTISLAARDLGIPVVSPNIQQNKVLFQNPLASKIMPSKNFMVEKLARFCADSLRTANIFIVNNDKPKDQYAITLFKNSYNEYLKTRYALTDTLAEVKGLAGLKSSYKTDKKNVYILLTENNSYVTEFFTQLGVYITDKKEITIVGNGLWLNNDNLDAGYFTRYNMIYASPYFINREDGKIKGLWKEYQDVYFSDPDEIFFQAYDLTWFYLNQLKEEGPDFWMKLDKARAAGLSMDFDFYSPNSETGLENRSACILRFREYKIVKAN